MENESLNSFNMTNDIMSKLPSDDNGSNSNHSDDDGNTFKPSDDVSSFKHSDDENNLESSKLILATETETEQIICNSESNLDKEYCENNVSSVSKNTKRKKGRVATVYITKIAILSSLSTVLYLFARFPIFPVFPFNVLDMDFSSIPSLLGGFALGPIAGVLIEFIKCSIKLITSSTSTIGELSNFIVSVSLVLPSAIIYKYKKNIKGALIGLTVGVLINLLVSSLSNYFLIVPLYAKLFLPSLMNLRIEFAFQYGLAFNAIKSISTSIITFFLYKRVSKLLHL